MNVPPTAGTYDYSPSSCNCVQTGHNARTCRAVFNADIEAMDNIVAEDVQLTS